MINARGFGKGSAIRAFDLPSQTFRFEAGGLGGARLGALRGQGGLEGRRSDGERYRLDGAGRERVREGSREVSRQNLVPETWLVPAVRSSVEAPGQLRLYRAARKPAESPRFLPCTASSRQACWDPQPIGTNPR